MQCLCDYSDLGIWKTNEWPPFTKASKQFFHVCSRRDVFEGSWGLLGGQASVPFFSPYLFPSLFLIRIHPFPPLAVTKHNPTPTYPRKHSMVVEGGWLDGGGVAPCHSTGQSYIQPALNTNSTHLRWPMTYSNVNVVMLFGGFRHAGKFSCLSGWSSDSYAVASKMTQELKALDTKPGRTVQSPGIDV